MAISLAACAVFGGTSDDEQQPGGGSSSGTPGSPPPPLDGTPSEDKITEQYGVFVAPGGAADADGTRAKPFGTIGAGLERAVAANKYVYVCTGTFKESIKVANGVSMIGGFDCERATWKLNGLRTRVESPTSPAITASDIKAPTRIEGFEIIAPDGNDASPTSIGLHAKSSPAITFAKSRIVAGKGKDGVAGVERPQLTLASSANGSPSSAQVGGPTGTFIGFPLYRAGEAGGIAGCDGFQGFPAPVNKNGGQGGKGGSYTSENTCPPASICGWYWTPASCGGFGPCNPTTPALNVGTVGPAGTDGASATQQGTLTGEGFTPRDGEQGTNGEAGSGGSGGKGGTMDSAFAAATGAGQQYGYGATGPGGGAGGCPGLAGSAGTGGAASIGALLVSSKGLTFDATEVVASNGGAGGKGGFGTNPTNGGAAGTALGAASAGQAGGAGGRSGVSGSGAGGPSFGIAQTLGDASLVNGATAKSGQGGAGVAEETKNDALGNAKTRTASVAGDAKDQYSF